jgi:hypothetical protein
MTRAATVLVLAFGLAWATSFVAVRAAGGQGHAGRDTGGHSPIGTAPASRGSHGGRGGPSPGGQPRGSVVGLSPVASCLGAEPCLGSRFIVPTVGRLPRRNVPLFFAPFGAWATDVDDQPQEPLAFSAPYAGPIPSGGPPAPVSYPESSSIQPLDSSLRPSQRASSPMATLKLDVEPRSAQVYVDGFFAGSVDAVNARGGLRATPGWHRLEFRAPGFQTPAVNVTFDTSRPDTYHFALRPNPRY